VGGIAAAYWAHIGPEWRGWHWLSAFVGGVILSAIFAGVLKAASRG
jgi:hypothetical protein